MFFLFIYKTIVDNLKDMHPYGSILKIQENCFSNRYLYGKQFLVLPSNNEYIFTKKNNHSLKYDSVLFVYFSVHDNLKIASKFIHTHLHT